MTGEELDALDRWLAECAGWTWQVGFDFTNGIAQFTSGQWNDDTGCVMFPGHEWRPTRRGDQAMMLLEKFGLSVEPYYGPRAVAQWWKVESGWAAEPVMDEDLKIAISLAVKAKIEATHGKGE